MSRIAKAAGAIAGLAQASGRAIVTKADSFADEVAEEVSRTISKGRIGKAIGAGTEGMLLGTATGSVIGGVSGAIDEDESFIGGALKGGLIGGGLGFTGGAASGVIHNNARLISNGVNDAKAIAGQISKWKAKQGNGIDMEDGVELLRFAQNGS